MIYLILNQSLLELICFLKKTSKAKQLSSPIRWSQSQSETTNCNKKKKKKKTRRTAISATFEGVVIKIPGCTNQFYWRRFKYKNKTEKKKYRMFGSHRALPDGVSHKGDDSCDLSFAFLRTHPLHIMKTYLFKYTENFTTKKMKIFRWNILIFSYFCSKHRLWVLVTTASTRRF